MTRTGGWTLAFTISGALWLLMALLTLPGCVSTISGSAYYDGRFWYLNAKSASDIAGGPRQDIVVVLDSDGRIVNQYQAAGPGTLQSVGSSIGPAIFTAGGQAAAGYLTRPARNTTNVNMEVQGTGGSGGTGGSNTTTANAPTTVTSSSGAATSTNTNTVTAP